ncbi:YitT family protein [Paenibacillus swuensis]|uniref:YitT family protein n=1 Tax=Paenibacillus swuensis TaxID=1178515 RepID=UPI0008391A41|nr:YitT family protein [Paenibacillus swuensis]
MKLKRWFTILCGCLLTAAGLIMLKHAFVLTGGTAGLALNVSYMTGGSFPLLFFLINIPFYVFAFLRMGASFTWSTLISISLLSVAAAADRYLPQFPLSPLLGAVMGGGLIGVGVTVLFLNRSSLGGANILALYLHDRYGINPGVPIFIFDFFVVLTGVYTVGLKLALYSILSVAVTSMVVGACKKKLQAAAKKGSVYPPRGSYEIHIPEASSDGKSFPPLPVYAITKSETE